MQGWLDPSAVYLRSPAFRSTSSRSASLTWRPASRRASTTGFTSEICPSSFARSRRPSVPVTGRPRARPQRRPAKSSMTTVHPVLRTAHDSTADSPFPRSQEATFETTETDGCLYCDWWVRSQCRAGLPSGPEATSRLTASGMTSSSERAGNRSAQFVLARRIIGEASHTHVRSATAEAVQVCPIRCLLVRPAGPAGARPGGFETHSRQTDRVHR